MKKLHSILLLVSTLVISACSSTGLSMYSVTNDELESTINEKLPSLTTEIRLLGIPVLLEVNDLDISIGPQQREIVVLAFESIAKISTFGINYPIKLNLKVEGNPFYDSKEKAIFIKDVNLLASSVDAGGFKGNLGVLDKEAMDLINSFLAVNPVYRLNQNNPTEALLSALPLDMRIVEGAITLVPKL